MLKEDGSREAEYQSALKAAQWQQWGISLMAKRQEYNGESRLRYQARTVSGLVGGVCAAAGSVHVYEGGRRGDARPTGSSVVGRAGCATRV